VLAPTFSSLSEQLSPKEPPGVAAGRLRGPCGEKLAATSGEASRQKKNAPNVTSEEVETRSMIDE
jgi:hypothetical protein